MDSEIFKLIYSKYYKKLLIYAYSLTGDYHVAETLVQNTFTKAFLSYREGGSIKYWLSKVLKNEYLNHIRYNNKFIAESEEILMNMKDSNNPIDIVISNESIREITKAIIKLPIKYKMVIMYSTYMDLTDIEISKIMDTSEVNIRKIRSRARQKLKEILNKGGYFYE